MNEETEAVRKMATLRAAYHRVFDGPDGRTVLQHIAKKGHIFSSTFVAGDPHETALNEGMRRLALSILRAFYKNESALLDQLADEYRDQE